MRIYLACAYRSNYGWQQQMLLLTIEGIFV